MTVALACLAIAAYLAFDWVDYGADRTCGSLVHNKGAGEPCVRTMQGRVILIATLGWAAIVLLWPAWIAGQPRAAETS